MKAALVLMLAAPAPLPTTVIAPAGSAAVPMTVISAPGASLTPSLAASPAPLAAPAIAETVSAAVPAPVFAVSAAALPALTAVTALPAASAGDAFDGAFAERRRKAAETVSHAQAEVPVVDYRRGAYSKGLSAEMLQDSYVVGEGRTMSGVELLSLVVTPESLLPDLTPDPDRVDFSRLGKTTAQIREALAEKDVPYHSYERWLGAAFREGLIYRLFNKNTGLTYYGVPPQVRADWGLEAVSEEKAAPAAVAEPVPQLVELAQFANDSVNIKDAEIFEFTAQAVAAAVKEGRLAPDAVSSSFRERAAKIDFDVPSLRDALLTLSESAEGTPWEAKTAALAALLP